MYCPRCGSPNNDTTKFCRQCGLALQQVTGYVASGGTSQFPQPPAAPFNPVTQATEGLTPKQKMIMAILLLVFSPAIFGTFGAVTGLEDFGAGLAGISAVLMPIGIVFAVMRYKAHQRKLQQATMQPPMYPHMPMQHQMPPPVAPYSLPPPMQPSISQPIQQPVQQPVRPPQNYQPPVYHQPPPPTNPLGPGSVIEDETKRLPDQRG